MKKIQANSAKAKPMLFPAADRESSMAVEPDKAKLRYSCETPQVSPAVDRAQQEEALAEAEGILLAGFSKLLDAKLAPIDSLLTSLNDKLTRL